MAIPVKLGVTDHVGFTGTLPDPPRFPGANAGQQAALDQWWANARGKIQSDSLDIKQTIEDIYRRLGALPTMQPASTVTNQVTIHKDYYLYIQSAPSNTWTINHNIGRYPEVELLDSSFRVMDGQVTHVDVNTMVIRFNWSLTGAVVYS